MKLASSVCLAMLALCLPAKADIVTIFAEGNVSAGNDNVGEFGGGSLTGLDFTSTFVFDTSLGSLQPQSTGQFIYGGTPFPFVSPLLSATLTINGHEVPFATPHYGELDTFSALFFADVETSDYNFAHLTLYLLNSSNLHLPTDFGSIGPFNSIPGDFQNSSFAMTQGGNQAFGNLNIETVTITNNGIAAVPGPIAGAGIPGLLALFGVGGLYWRRKWLGI